MANLNIDSKETSVIGGLGMTRITVYDQKASPDGNQSGCPHVHAITTEAYYIVEGFGSVEFHDMEKGFYTVALTAGMFLQFPPNTVHRLVNTGKLVILGLMANAGLAENGDARIYFGENIDEDPDAYSAAVALVKKGLDGALERRDLSVKGYTRLVKLWSDDKDAYFKQLKRFIDKHQSTVPENKEKFQNFIENGPKLWAKKTEALLNQTSEEANDPIIQDIPKDLTLLGMCGVLHPIQNKAI